MTVKHSAAYNLLLLGEKCMVDIEQVKRCHEMKDKDLETELICEDITGSALACISNFACTELTDNLTKCMHEESEIHNPYTKPEDIPFKTAICQNLFF